MVKMSGGEALAKSLANEGVEVVFGIPGIQIYGIVAGLWDEPSIRMITTRHEQATTYMADGYARASGKPGVALVVQRGVGLYNAASGLTNAYSRAAPILLVAGQIPRAAIGKNLGAVHEIADQPSAVRSVTKWQRQASRPREVPDAVFEAFRQMRTGRPRHRPISPAAHICRRRSGALRRGGGTRQARRGDEYSRRYLQWRQGHHSGRPSPVVRLLFQPLAGRDRK